MIAPAFQVPNLSPKAEALVGKTMLEHERRAGHFGRAPSYVARASTAVMDRRCGHILRILAKAGECSKADICEELGVSRNEAFAALRILLKAGSVTVQGDRHTSLWSLAQ